ncbi:hypothetical protein [Microbacterium sp. T2.11-28]|jgi:hypothetical protein|uniref:hypothetical protein n=1 Tax=unclassified Microbacterium TaxID=2609290 RepID=UPI002477C6F8|nr:hypothetical protein [Microbacterium sp. T2.11-28]CAI9390020.1 hypothetical protein MICABA_01309 [Microbacterium sp. T2.11-28]
MMATDLPGEELFIGQVIALLPVTRRAADVVEDDDALRAALAGADDDPRGRARTRTYSVVTFAPHRGIFLLDGNEIEVSIHPLDIDTPLEAAVFRVVSISGRALRVKRAVAATDATAS